MVIADYLNKLVELKNDLITTLRNKGVDVSDDEKLNTLVPKVEEVEGEQSVEFIDDVPEDFNFSDAIKSVVIPYGVKNIKDYAFYYYNSYVMWSNFEKVEIPDSVVSIGNSAFQTSSSNLKDLTIPMSVESIGTKAFYSYAGNVIVPRNATVGDSAFYNTAVLCPSEGTDITNAPWGAYLGDIHDFDENGICKICGHKAKIFCTDLIIKHLYGEPYLVPEGKMYSTRTDETGTTVTTTFTITVFEEVEIPIIFSCSLTNYSLGSSDSIFVTITDLSTNDKVYNYNNTAKLSSTTVAINTTIILPIGTYAFKISSYVRNTSKNAHNFVLPVSCNW